MKGFLKKGKITRADLEGLKFELLKNIFNNIIELEYNLEQCYLAMTNKIDWVNPEGDRFHIDLSKPLPLEGPPGSHKSPTKSLFDVGLSRISIFTVTNLRVTLMFWQNLKDDA
ncbi:hypothetical protein Tco_0904445 [Tanacetum coccineum]